MHNKYIDCTGAFASNPPPISAETPRLPHVTRTISIIGYKRPALFDGLLRSLLRNDLSGWRIEIQIEPSEYVRDFTAIASNLLREHEHALHVNERQLGVLMNGHSLLQRLFFSGAELNIYLEEDLVVAPDICRLAQWYVENHQPHWLCLSLLSGMCGSAGPLSDTSHPEILFESRGFNSLGFVMRRQEWEAHMRHVWIEKSAYLCNLSGTPTYGWDWSMFRALAESGTMRAVHPLTARASHTGREGGVHCAPEFHDRAFGKLRVYDGRDIPVYRLVSTEMLPSLARAHTILTEEMIEAWACLLAERRRHSERKPARLKRALARLRDILPR